MQTVAKLRLRRTLVWISRIIVGFTFIISGWAKSIDPWGFLIKVNEYLTVWGLTVPREAVLTACVALACVEFCTGVLIATGSFKRTAVWVAAAMMAVMLPLTLYIAVANPVSDCGCFGDFWVISNGATLAKNIVLTALIIYLIWVNHTVSGFYPAPIQWMEVTFSLAFPLLLAFIGYHVQPLVDFRPYKIGTVIFEETGGGESDEYIYEKDGQQESFPLDALPDSTWTFVRVEESDSEKGEKGFEVRDEDDYDISAEIGAEKGPVLMLIVPDPDMAFLARAHFANALYEYSRQHGITMIGIAGAGGETLSKWVGLFRPQFPVYSAEDTALKQLVRGDEALVYTDGGTIRWKRSLNWMDPSIPERKGPENVLADIQAVDDGRLHTFLASVYVALMLITYLLGLSPRILRFFVRLARNSTAKK